MHDPQLVQQLADFSFPITVQSCVSTHLLSNQLIFVSSLVKVHIDRKDDNRKEKTSILLLNKNVVEIATGLAKCIRSIQLSAKFQFSP